ncbi:unnamed protein product, partial [Closterium sp. NIES-53]
SALPGTAPAEALHTFTLDSGASRSRVSGQGRERYFLLVVDDYTRYTTAIPLRSKGEVPGVLIRWIRTVRLQLRERFRQDLPILHLHSDRGAPHWLSHGGRSYLHDPCGCSPFSVAVCGPVRCASAQPLAPCLLAGDLANTALVFQVWGSRAFVCDTSADKLSARAIPCVFLGFPLDAPGWQFYHPTSRCVLPSQDVTFDNVDLDSCLLLAHLAVLCLGLGSDFHIGTLLATHRPVVLTGHANASWVDDLATQRSSQGYTFSLGSGSVSWRSTRSSSVLSSSCEVEIYAGAMAAQELHWLTYLLTDLGEQPRSSPVLYVDNKAMIALCQEHRLEHRTKHISLRYFLAQDLQQRGQLCLAYMAIRANTADIHQGTLVW